jgi:hypothetical protein
VKVFLVIALLIIGVSSVSAQMTEENVKAKEPCNLTLAQAPLIGGLRLGMTPDEVMALFPGSSEDSELRAQLSKPATEFGATNFVVSPDKYKSKDKFAGVSRIAFTLLDGRVYNFSITYKGPLYPHVDKFVESFVAGKNLPAADAWEPYAGMDEQLKILTCSGFEIRAFASRQEGVLNYIMVKDLDVEQKLKERKIKAREKRAQTAKP